VMLQKLLPDFDCLTDWSVKMTLNFVETAWLNAAHYNNAMDVYQTHLASKASKATGDAPKAAAPVQAKSSNLVNKIQETRNNIKEALNKPSAASDTNLEARIESVEAENKALKTELAALTQRFSALESRLNNLGSGAAPAPAPKAAAPAPAAEESDDDVDLFGSDDEDDAEAERIKAERVAAYNERKAAKEAKKGVLIAKSNIILDVKPWDDETDMGALEAEVRKIETDGLLWGAAKLVPVGYGIKKLQICCVVEDDKVGTDFLEEEICALEDYVQSVDVAAFNKI